MSAKTGKKKEGGGESGWDLEQQYILRLPPGPAMALRQDVRQGNLYTREKISIEINPDMRRGAVRYGNDFFHAKMVDLPTIIECHKTVDKKTFYKTADICQMLVTTTEDDIAQDENESPKKKDKDKRFHWSHGITPPLKNVRRRRFRKTLKKKYMDQPDIEKEVKRLFRTDAEAISVKWEIVTEDEKSAESGSHVQSSDSMPGTSGSLLRADTAASLDIDIFGELSSSEEEDEKDVNIMDSGGEEDTSCDISRQQSFMNLDSLASESQDALEPDPIAMQNLTELGRQLEDITEQMKIEQDPEENEDEIDTSMLKS